MIKHGTQAKVFFQIENDLRQSQGLDRGAYGHSDVVAGIPPRTIFRESAYFEYFVAELLVWE